MSFTAGLARLEKAFNKRFPEQHEKAIGMIYLWTGVFVTFKVGGFLFGSKKKTPAPLDVPQSFTSSASGDNKYGFTVPTFDTIDEWSKDPKNFKAWEKWVETPGNIEKWEKGLL